MSNIVLVIPKYIMKSITTGKGKSDEGALNNIQFDPPLHVTYLAASLEKAGYNVIILDENVIRGDIMKVLKREKPFIIGVHVNSFSLRHVKNLLHNIRKELGSIIVIGGPHVNFDPSSVVYLGADYGLLGEAEISFVSLVGALKEKKDATNIPGLIVKKGENVNMTTPETVVNLDNLPFPSRHLTIENKYHGSLFENKTASVMTSRGCIYNCIFCSSPSKTMRMRSPENVVEELDVLMRQGYKSVNFQDDLFTYDRERVMRLCNLIKERGIHLKWFCNTRADMLDPALLIAMREAGCVVVGCGVETGNDRVRNVILRKGVTNDTLVKAFRMIRETGIQSAAFVMFGHPTETLYEMRDTINFILKLDLDYADFNLTTIIPGTQIYTRALQEGKITQQEWRDVTEDKKEIPIYVPDGVKLEQMQKVQKEAFFRFYYRPKVIWREMCKIRSFTDMYLRLKRSAQLFSYFS